MRSTYAALSLPTILRSLFGLALAILISACSTASGPGGMSTASLPSFRSPSYPPSQGIAQRGYAGAAPASAYGTPLQQSAAYPNAPQVTGQRHGYQRYQWNGNNDRVQAGAASQPAALPAHLTWKATPPAPPHGTPVKTALNERAAIAKAMAAPGGPQEIVVGPGDTLYSIAKHHDVSMASLMEANHLQQPVIKVSQHLVLPAASR